MQHLSAAPLLALRPPALPAHDPATRRAWHRAQRAGSLTPAAADRIAIRLFGLHPSAVWGDAWWTA